MLFRLRWLPHGVLYEHCQYSILVAMHDRASGYVLCDAFLCTKDIPGCLYVGTHVQIKGPSVAGQTYTFTSLCSLIFSPSTCIMNV